MIAGQGTIGLELLEQVSDLEAVVVPIGGGGLISGVACAVKEMRPAIRVIGDDFLSLCASTGKSLRPTGSPFSAGGAGLVRDPGPLPRCGIAGC